MEQDEQIADLRKNMHEDEELLKRTIQDALAEYFEIHNDVGYKRLSLMLAVLNMPIEDIEFMHENVTNLNLE